MSLLGVINAMFAGVGLYMAVSFLFVRLVGSAPRHYLPYSLACFAMTVYIAAAAVLYSVEASSLVRHLQMIQICSAVLAVNLLLHFARVFTGRRDLPGLIGLSLLWLVLVATVASWPTDLLFTDVPAPKNLSLFGIQRLVHETATGPAAPFLMAPVTLACIWLVVMLVGPVRRKVTSAGPFLFGAVTLLVATIQDSLVAMGVYAGSYYMEVGFLTIAVSGSVSLTLDSRKRERDLERAHLELRELRHVEAQLARSERLAVLGRMLSGVAHELNNPLTSVVGVAEGLRPEDMADEIAPKISLMRREALRAGNLVRGLLEIARKEGGEFGPVSLDEIVAQVVTLRAEDQDASGITCHVDIEGQTPVVEGDPDQLFQLLFNLVINAEQAQASVPAGLGATRNIWISLRNEAQQVVLTVEDDGPGIPDELLPRVFDPFFTTRQQSKGTGLGLFLGATVAERHLGSLSARNVPDRGARFTLRLPLTYRRPVAADDSIPIDIEAMLMGSGIRSGSRASAALAELRGGGDNSTDKPLTGCSIAVVDDEEGVVMSVQTTLEAAGAHVRTAHTAAVAIELLNDGQWDAVLCDVIMPDMDGLELLEQVRVDNPDLAQRFVFMTGDIFAASVQEMSGKLEIAVLQKPFRSRELLQVIQKVMRQQQENEAERASPLTSGSDGG